MNVSTRVAGMCAKVRAVHSHQLRNGDVADPVEEGDPGVTQINRQRPDNFEVRLLEHIRRIHAAVQTAVEPCPHQSVQAVPVFHELPAHRLHVPGAAA